MSTNKRTPVRFSLLTVFVWLLVAGGIIFILWQVINRISASSLALGTPTANPTQVLQTIAAIVSAEAINPTTVALPTQTPTPHADPTPTPSTPLPTPSGSITRAPSITATPTALCNRAAAGNPIDMTVPDDSLISPGQSFIKTWKLVNVGTCPWTTAYSASFFYGDQMNAPNSVPVQQLVLPAHSVEISVEMVAPLAPGTYQGNWKLKDPAGILFGIGPNGDAPFWVRIMVAENPTATATTQPTASTTPTGAVTPSPTPVGQVSGELKPAVGDSIDLDTLTLNSGGADLVYRVDASQYHWLAPQLKAMLGIYGSQEPTQVNCTSANMSSAPIAVESLPAGTYLCYRTNSERVGKMHLEALDPITYALTLYLTTWAER